MENQSQGPYQPLHNDSDTEDRFRLLSLAPGSYDDPINITLTTHNIPLTPKAALESIKLHSKTISTELRDFYSMYVVRPHSVPRFFWDLDNSSQSWDFHGSRLEALNFVRKVKAELRLLDLYRFKLNRRFVDAYWSAWDLSSRFLRPVIEYEALSYVWGTTRAAHAVTANGFLLGITQNLDLALRHLRDPIQAKVIWIDALCINQEDIDERNYQVPLMGSIYEGASQTTVWLGPAADESDLVMEAIRTFNMHDMNPFCLSIDILRLMTRSWWSRVWVIQEVALAQRVVIQCGMQSIPVVDFLVGLERACNWGTETKLKDQSEIDDAARKLSHSRDLLEFLPRVPIESVFTQIANGMGYDSMAHSMYNHLSEFWCVRSRRQSLVLRVGRSGSPFSGLWDLSRNFLATDPRDKVYALLSMTSFSVRPIRPDYRKSDVSVLSEALALVISENLGIAYCKGSLRREQVSISDLPSWVPGSASSFSPSAIREDILWSGNGPKACCPAADLIEAACSSLIRAPGSITYSPKTAFSDDFKELYTVGTKHGTVIKSITLFTASFTYVEVRYVVEQLVAIRQLFHAHRPSPQNLLSVLKGIPGVPFDPEEDDIRLIEVMFDPAWPASLTTSTNNLNSFRAWLRYLDERTLFVTDTGQFGRSQGDIKEGDVLAGLFGIDLPFVLRPKDGGKYAMINTAHVADHLLSPPWKDRDQRFRKRKRQRTRREEKFTII
jgi:hypothetical protein